MTDIGLKNWANASDELDADDTTVVSREQKADGSILKTLKTRRTDESGKKVEVITKVRVSKKKVQIHKAVEERRHWRKFGDAAGVPPGPEPGVTGIADDVTVEPTRKMGDAPKKAEKKTEEVVNLSIVCRNCGRSGHWTLKCPYANKANLGAARDVARELGDRKLAEEQGPIAVTGEVLDRSKIGKYVPPGKNRDRGGMGGGPSAQGETTTIRVTNLSEDTRDQDVQDLFHPFGPIQRIYLAKDKSSGLSKGFAFVTFVYRGDAAKAIDKVSGKGYDHLILHCEWANPPTK